MRPISPSRWSRWTRRVRVRGPGRARVLPIADLFRLPGDTPERETVLEPGELIVAVEVPAAPRRRSHYLKVRDRASFEFAVVSVAVALDVEDGVIRAARLAAGGVGTVPWRLAACEQALAGARAEPAAFAAPRRTRPTARAAQPATASRSNCCDRSGAVAACTPASSRAHARDPSHDPR